MPPDRITCCRRAAPRAARGGLSAADFVRVSTVQRLSAAGIRRSARAAIALARAEGLLGACGVNPDAPDVPGRRIAAREGRAVSYEYERVATPASGLRLHLNENTAGCSPAVLEALGS